MTIFIAYRSRDRCRCHMPTDEPATDSELAARVRGGDRNALEQLVRRHTPLVLKMVDRLKLPSSIDRLDIVQEGLLALSRAASKWVPGHGSQSKLSTYAWAAIRNAITDEVNAQHRALRILDSGDDHSSLEHEIDQFPAPSGIDQDAERLARECVGRLPRLHRLAVTLAAGLDGPPLRTLELATRLGMTPAQTKRVLASAAERMRRMIG